MIQSMTAFARAETTLNSMSITLELRSVNHRYLDISIRAPEELRETEQHLRTQLAERLSRGKVELNLRTQMNTQRDSAPDIQLNMPLVEQISQASQRITQHLHNADKVSPLDILRWPGVMQTEQINKKALLQTIGACLQQALNELVDMRQREGEKLAAMLLERCDAMEKIVGSVEKSIPSILEARKQKILSRIAEFDFEQDDKRIEQEIVLLAQKMDVSEETDRLGAHISEVRNVLKQARPVGRRLDFLMQELNREANTLGSKSVDTHTTRASIDLKVFVEQMREQVQNIE